MRLLVALYCSTAVYLSCQAKTSPKPKVKAKAKHETESESTEEIRIASNESLYTTAEMRDMVMKEMAGKTEEVQAYFDEFPSKEFKENSEDLKFKLYYERKGLKEIDSTQTFNITPGPFREPPGPMYTIEVNDSYVPKYRMSTSEELRIEREDTFHPEKSDETSVPLKQETEESKSDDDSSSESTDEPSDKKKKKAKSKWPRNMDPKKKKKTKDSTQLANRRTQVEQEIYQLKGRNIVNTKRNKNNGRSEHKELNQKNGMRFNQNRQRNIQHNLEERKPHDDEDNIHVREKPKQARRRLSQPGLRPFL